MDYHRADHQLAKYLDIETNEKLDLLIEQRNILAVQIWEERSIKRQEMLRLKSLEKKRNYYNRFLKQLSKIEIILDNKERTKKEKYDETKTLEDNLKYYRARQRKLMLKSIKEFCEYNIMKYKEAKYETELILEIESTKGKI